MLEIVPYKLDSIKNSLKIHAIEEFGLADAEFEGSNTSQLINLLAYSTVINNTNFTFGLNEMFITQATDRRNVIKHARQMGYSHKRKVSYQYKIKLEVLESGEVSLNKYTEFKSPENNYIYMGENKTDFYGTHIFIKNLINEYNNNQDNIYDTSDITKGKFIINEDGVVCKILDKESVAEPRLLLQVMDTEENNLDSTTTIGQNIYIHDGTYNKGYRNFITVGSLDTYIATDDILKVQMSPNLTEEFPKEYNNTFNSTIIVDNSQYVMDDNTNTEIDSVVSVTLTKDDVTINVDLEDVEINYKNIIITSDEDITDYDVELEYKNIKDEDGFIVDRIYLSDLRGTILEEETNYDVDNNPLGFSGFYASNYNKETNILEFKIGLATQEDIDSGITSNKSVYNAYNSNNTIVSINEALNTPFMKSRFSTTNEIIENDEIVGYEPFDKSKVFCSVLDTKIKNELEIIVKEGVIRRWNTETKESIANRQYAMDNNLALPEIVFENPELKVNINEYMATAGHFTIKNDDIENNGIELFVTRVLQDGLLEVNEPWIERDYLLAEKIPGEDKTFVSLSDEDYEDYINIYTKYAGTGTPLTMDMSVFINLLTSKGKEGNTNSLIESTDSRFKAKYYIEDTLTPILLHIEGSDVESTDTIRNTAPLFSNTANRAVTSNDYKTICEAQPYIQGAKIWGGEDETPYKIPGHIFFSIIPYSRQNYFSNINETYRLNNINTLDMFYPSYYQITGKNRYDDLANKEDEEVLFNLLDRYKIITLQLNYVKAIYLDTNIEIEVLKYKFGRTVKETNKDIFDNINKYFDRNIEQFDSTLYMSSLSRYIDEQLGDNYGIKLNTKFSVDLYDSLIKPDEGMFVDKSTIDTNLWKFIMPLAKPIEDTFSNSTVINNEVINVGSLITDNLTHINTKDFILLNDYLYMDLNINNISSYTKDNILEDVIPNNKSEIIEINIMYVEDSEFNTLGELINSSYKYKVGSYFIHKTQNIIRVELNTSLSTHIYSKALVTSKMVEDLVEYYDGDDKYNLANEQIGMKLYYKVDDEGNYVLVDGEKVYTLYDIETDNTYYNIEVPYVDVLDEITNSDGVYKEVSLDRNSFFNNIRVLNITAKDSNIEISRNVFTRLKQVKFI